MMMDFDVHFIDRNGYWNHKILEACSESDVAEYMVSCGYTEFEISVRGV